MGSKSRSSSSTTNVYNTDNSNLNAEDSLVVRGEGNNITVTDGGAIAGAYDFGNSALVEGLDFGARSLDSIDQTNALNHDFLTNQTIFTGSLFNDAVDAVFDLSVAQQHSFNENLSETIQRQDSNFAAAIDNISDNSSAAVASTNKAVAGLGNVVLYVGGGLAAVWLFKKVTK